MNLSRSAFAAVGVVVIALAACVPVPAVQVGTGPATTPAIDLARIAEDVRVLASDEFEGRAPTTRGEELTVNYLVEQLSAAGVQPGGPNGSWFQEVPLVQSDIVGTPSLSFTVAGQPRALTQGEEIAVRSTMLNVDRVTLSNAPVVFLGYGVRAPERNWDDFKGQDMRGRIGLVLVNDPDFETGVGDFGGKTMTYYGRWTYKYEEAARQGMAGMLVIHETEPASYGWPTVRNSNINTMFDIVRANPAEVHPPVEGWIQRDLAVELLRANGHDFEALKRQAQTREFQPVTLGNTTFSADFGVRRATIRTRNVLGRVAGSTHPDETILYGAHWDHLGIGRPDARGDSIYNGAIDNALGTAIVLEIARAFAAGPRPQRSVVFALWTAEERGLLGSEYYADNPVYPLETTVAGINIDAPQPAGPARDLVVIGSGQSELEDYLERLVTAAGRVVAPDPNPEAGYFFRSDHFPLAKRGAPMLYTKAGVDLLDGGTAAGDAYDAAWRRDRYHQQADVYDPATWDLRGIVQDATILYRMGLELANSRAWPNYRPTSEFRPIRDQSAARRVAQGHVHPPDAPERLGTVHFATSCAPSVAPEFNRAVALLHSFEFGSAIRAFRAVLAADSTCAMAYWGLALSNWNNPMAAGNRAPATLQRGREIIQAAEPFLAGASDRERAYIGAVAQLYTDYETRDQPTRLAAYERAMGEVAANDRDDTEARIFHALALAASASPTDKTYANQLRAGAILESILVAQPDHPGVAHYIIHSYDFPPLADRAATAAQRYAEIAPSAAHALHMPSHTFTRVGMWHESVGTNLRSIEAAGRGGSWSEVLHAADYAVYAYLQMRRDSAARTILDGLPAIAARFDPNAVTGAAPGSAGLFALAAIPARYALERHAWDEAAELRPTATTFQVPDALTYFARALGAARTDNTQLARESIDSLGAISARLATAREPYWAEQVAIQQLGARAWLVLAEGRADDALRLMREAADREDATEKSAVTPGPLAPARESLGDMLMQLDQPAEALEQYRRALTREPNRYWSLDGAMKAAGAAGDRAAAAGYAEQIARLTGA